MIINDNNDNNHNKNTANNNKDSNIGKNDCKSTFANRNNGNKNDNKFFVMDMSLKQNK